MRFYTTVNPPPFIPLEVVDKALQDATLAGAKAVLAEGNRLMQSSAGGRAYGAHVAAAVGQPPAVFTGNLVKSGSVAPAHESKPHVVGAVAQWTAPHAHLMADGFMHKPHRPRPERGNRRGWKKRWGKDETPGGSVFVPPHPFARPAGLAMLVACNDFIKNALAGLKK